MATLYVTVQGARIEKEYRRLLVTKDDEVLFAVPAVRVSEVVFVGRVGATTPAMISLLDEGIPLSMVTRAGKLRGRLAAPKPTNLALRHAQYDQGRDPQFCLAVARAIVAGKLRNSLSLTHRMRRTWPGIPLSDLDTIGEALEAARDAGDLDTLRGLEGTAARAYYRVLRRGLRAGMTFSRRTRRPPRDPVNALLSFGYTLLTQNLIAACEIVGFDPYDGFFHADKRGRPALALDLVEEFRAVVVDSVVRRVVNQRVLGPEDFVQGDKGGVYLTRRGLRVFLRHYTHRLNTRIMHPYAGRRLTYQKIFEVQARILAKVVLGKLDAYRPFRVR